MRQQLKSFSQWPTYPQLYVNGELIGGLDILKEMIDEGDIAKQLGVEKIVRDAQEDLNRRLKALVNSAPVLLFMKGSPQVRPTPSSLQTTEEGVYCRWPPCLRFCRASFNSAPVAPFLSPF